jgi:hypothetical protein
MTVLATNVVCQAGGTTVVTLSFESQQSGSSSDRASFRIVRRRDGQADVVLPSAPQFYMGANRDIRSWTFIDVGVPDTATYAYVVQIMRLAGGGTFYAMNLVANHYRR